MLVILGNQLFPLQHLPPPRAGPVYMAEDLGLCTYERHHQQKIVLFLSAMRAYADELRVAGYEVHYQTLNTTDVRPYETRLAATMDATNSTRLLHFEVEDKAMEARLIAFAEKHE